MTGSDPEKIEVTQGDDAHTQARPLRIVDENAIPDRPSADGSGHCAGHNHEQVVAVGRHGGLEVDVDGDTYFLKDQYVLSACPHCLMRKAGLDYDPFDDDEPDADDLLDAVEKMCRFRWEEVENAFTTSAPPTLDERVDELEATVARLTKRVEELEAEHEREPIEGRRKTTRGRSHGRQ